jgi:hypothetical protein
MSYSISNQSLRTQKSTNEIRELLNKANSDFEITVNKALNDFLPKIFSTCPFTDELALRTNHVWNVIVLKLQNKRNFD